jgi:hypothetical protein
MGGMGEGQRVVEIMLVAEVTVSGDEDPGLILDEARGACDELPINLCSYTEPKVQRDLGTACQNAAHALSSLIAGDDEVMAALRKLDAGEELVEEIRDVIKTWNEAGESFIRSQRAVTA